jgi:hypothetical protein
MTNGRIFNLNIKFNDPFQDKLFTMVKGPLEHVLAFPRLNRAYADVARMADSRPFAEKVLDQLNVNYDLSDKDLSKIMIPTGPVIVVANHEKKNAKREGKMRISWIIIIMYPSD